MKSKIKQNIVLLLVTIIIFIIFLEFSVRILKLSPAYGYPQGMYQNDDLLDYRLTPNFFGKVVKQEFRTNFKTNSLGMNDIEYQEKEGNDFRILALGDSFTWGAYGTESNETFLKIIQSKLNGKKIGKHFQVMNTGVPGYGTDQELLYLQERGIKLEPDLILLNFYINNDFEDNLRQGEMEVNAKGQLIFKKNKINLLRSFRNFLFKHFHSYRMMENGIINLMGSKLSKVINKEIATKGEFSDIFTKKYNQETFLKISKTLNFLEEMNRFTKKKKLSFIIVLIPAKFQMDYKLNHKFDNNEYSLYDFEKPNKIITEWAKRREIIIIDLLSELETDNLENDFYWTLNPHWTKKGNQEAAEIIYRHLIEENLIKNN